MPDINTFGIQTLGLGAQPVFGTTLSLDTQIAPDPFQPNTSPSAQYAMSKLTLTSVIGFQTGFRIAVAPKENFSAPPSWAFQDCGLILSIENNVLMVQGLVIQHFAGEWVVVCEDCSEVEIVPVVPNDAMYIGAYSTVSATDPSVFDIIPAYASGAPTYSHQSRQGTGANTYKTSEYFIFGTADDQFVARFTRT